MVWLRHHCPSLRNLQMGLLMEKRWRTCKELQNLQDEPPFLRCTVYWPVTGSFSYSIQVSKHRIWKDLTLGGWCILTIASSLQGRILIWDTMTAGIPWVLFHQRWESLLMLEIGLFQQVSHPASMLWGKARQGWHESVGLITVILRLADMKEFLKTSSGIVTIFSAENCFI